MSGMINQNYIYENKTRLRDILLQINLFDIVSVA